MRAAGSERGRVVGEDPAEGGLRPAAPHPEPAHVGDVEEARAPPGREVFRDDPGPVLDRHLPPREVDHPAAVLPVPAVERGPLEGGKGGTGRSLGSGHEGGRRLAPAAGRTFMGGLLVSCHLSNVG